MYNVDFEEWRDIPGFEGHYKASSLGRIKSLDRVVVYSTGQVVPYKGRIMNPSINHQGYYRVHLSKQQERKVYAVHTLIAQSFFGNFENLTVDHIDGNKLNNKIENLQLITINENASKGKGENRSSDYIGVSWHKQCKKWIANICIKGKNVYLGAFDDEFEAAKAYTDKKSNINKNLIYEL
jgi:NUMOD4 motif/HNH endonuclease/AP2 domain